VRVFGPPRGERRISASRNWGAKVQLNEIYFAIALAEVKIQSLPEKGGKKVPDRGKEIGSTSSG